MLIDVPMVGLRVWVSAGRLFPVFCFSSDEVTTDWAAAFLRSRYAEYDAGVLLLTLSFSRSTLEEKVDVVAMDELSKSSSEILVGFDFGEAGWNQDGGFSLGNSNLRVSWLRRHAEDVKRRTVPAEAWKSVRHCVLSGMLTRQRFVDCRCIECLWSEVEIEM